MNVITFDFIPRSVRVRSGGIVNMLQKQYPDRLAAVALASESSATGHTKDYSKWTPSEIVADVVEEEILQTLMSGSDASTVPMLFIATALQREVHVYCIDDNTTDHVTHPAVSISTHNTTNMKILLVPWHPLRSQVRYSHYAPLVPKHMMKMPGDGLCGARHFNMCFKKDEKTTLECSDCHTYYHRECVEPSDGDTFHCGCVQSQPREFEWFLTSDDTQPVEIFLGTTAKSLQKMWQDMEKQVTTSQRYRMHDNPQSINWQVRREVMEERGMAYMPSQGSIGYHKIASHIELSIFGEEKKGPIEPASIFANVGFSEKYKAIKMIPVLFPEVLATWLKLHEKFNRMEIEAIFKHAGEQEQQTIHVDEEGTVQ